MDRLKSLVGRWLNNALPGSCLLCGSDSPDALLCPPCAADLPAPPSTCCPQCAEQTTYGERCGACLKDPPHFDQTLAAFHYDFPADRIIHALKYGHQLVVAKWLGHRLAALIKTGEALVMPLPLHPERLRERGFNQSMEIARVLGNQLNLSVDHNSLFRNRPTPRQADLPLKERRKNVRGAFECTADMTGKKILLIDDVMTSGATLNECSRVLKLHGAAHVTAVVAARALKH